MLGGPPATRWMGPAARVAVTGTRSGVPLLKLLTQRAPLWKLSPLAPIGRASVATGASAASVSHRGVAQLRLLVGGRGDDHFGDDGGILASLHGIRFHA
jgi:hypothetical protein